MSQDWDERGAEFKTRGASSLKKAHLQICLILEVRKAAEMRLLLLLRPRADLGVVASAQSHVAEFSLWMQLGAPIPDNQ